MSREQHDHRRAEQEPAHLLALFERNILVGIGPLPNLVRGLWPDDAMPDRRHAADDGRADQDHREWAMLG